MTKGGAAPNLRHPEQAAQAAVSKDALGLQVRSYSNPGMAKPGVCTPTTLKRSPI